MRRLEQGLVGLAALVVLGLAPAVARATLVVPADITREALGSNPVVVTYTTPISLSGLPAACTPPSGSSFEVGETPVNCSTLGDWGPAGCNFVDPFNPCTYYIPPDSGSFKVTILQGAGPTLSGLADQTVTAPPGASSVVVIYPLPTASDPSGVDTSSLQCSPASGSQFPIGATTVTCTVKDSVGNQSSGSFVVTVLKGATTQPVTLGSPKLGRRGVVSLAVGCPAANPARCAGKLVLDTAKKHIRLGARRSRSLPVRRPG